MKGHAKIELFNAESGELERVYEEDNLVTNAVKYLLAFMNKINRQPSNEVTPIATNALGGIMLFDDTLDEDPENIEFPSDAHLVAYSDRSLNTSNPMRGSFNSLESGSRDDGYTAVWDFGTSQANGTIKSVALTSNYSGADPFLRLINPVYSTITFRNDPLNPNIYWPIRHDGKYTYFLNSNNGHVYKAKENPFKYDSVHSGTGAGDLVLEEVADVGAHLPSLYDANMKTNKTYWHDGDDGYIYVVWFNYDTYDYNHRPYYSNGGRLSIIKINYGDDSWDVGEEQVVTLPNANLHQIGQGWFAASNGYLYWVSSDNTSIYIINLHNTVDVRKISVGGANESSIRVESRLRPALKGDGILFGYTFRKPNDSTDYVRWGFMFHDGLMSKDAATGDQTYDVYDKIPICKICYTASVNRYMGSGIYHASELSLHGAYLGTINNLASPIEKTASQTMKITYTLTDVEEEEENNG